MKAVVTRADPKISGFGKSRKSRTNPNEPENFDSGFRSERYFSFAVRSDLEHSFVRKFPNPERSDYTNLMRNYEACKGAKIDSIRPEPINWSPGGYRMADKINQTVSQSIHGWMKTLSRSFSVMSTRRLCFVAANENWLKSLNKYFRSGSFGFSGFQIISFGFVREVKFEQKVFGFRSFGLNSFSDQL